jgi:hypothetical protein
MAINIFQGAAGQKRGVNSASQSSRAKAATAAVGGSAATSDSGNVAVKTGGSTLSKIGNTVGKVAEVASKFLPGIGGTIAKGISNIFNDPEWWQSVPGEAISLNVPLRVVKVAQTQRNFGNGLYIMRPAIADIHCYTYTTTPLKVFTPTLTMITQYLMPEIRKVVNAIPLQSAEAYQEVLNSHATIYAMWRQLKKIDYITKHGQTYLPNMNVSTFPLFQVDNAAWLQSTINRLEEYLRANVRIPHTLCEYLAWRFGRCYRSHNSAKAALVTYNVLPLDVPIDIWNTIISETMSVISGSTANQQANTDLYNAYFDHDLMVEIRDDTQFSYDMKEFMLRTNMDVGTILNTDNNPNLVYIDSSLDNITVFMASTVSTYGVIDSTREVLLPVQDINIYCYSSENVRIDGEQGFINPGWTVYNYRDVHPQGSDQLIDSKRDSDGNYYFNLSLMQAAFMTMFKALDFYNKDLYLGVAGNSTSMNSALLDITAPAFDLGQVDDIVLGNEHVFAFANLVYAGRKVSMSRSAAEKVVAKETANLIDKLDVAAVASK